MSAVIDNLISKEEYNIYVNEYIRDEKLCELASLLEKEDDNLETYFNTRRSGQYLDILFHHLCPIRKLI